MRDANAAQINREAPDPILRDDPCDSPEIRECKAILRGDTMKIGSRKNLADAIDDRSNWFCLAHTLRDALQNALTYINEDRGLRKTTEQWMDELLFSRAALEDADEMMRPRQREPQEPIPGCVPALLTRSGWGGIK